MGGWVENTVKSKLALTRMEYSLYMSPNYQESTA
jgi:hypothetical protein